MVKKNLKKMKREKGYKLVKVRGKGLIRLALIFELPRRDFIMESKVL